MIHFTEISTEMTPEEWDRNLNGFHDASFLQAYSFGEYNSGGEKLFRYIMADDNKVLVMAQCLLRQLPFGICILSIRGGPVFQRKTSTEATNLKNLRNFLQNLLQFLHGKFRRLYVSITMHSERSMQTEIALREAGLSRPLFERDPYLTYVVPLHADPQSNMKSFDVKWRNQLRRALDQSPDFIWGNHDDMLISYIALHNSMCEIKSLDRFGMTYGTLAQMRQHLGDSLQLVIGRHNGKDVCGCAIVMIGDKAFYYFAAANEPGRKGYFSNAMVWFLIQKLHEIGISELDLSGIDPVRNWGGYHFKKGIGGLAYAYMGEWNLGKPKLLSFLMNCVLYWRSRRLYH